MGSGEAAKEQKGRRETEVVLFLPFDSPVRRSISVSVVVMLMIWFQDSRQVGRYPNCGYGAGLKMVVPARRRRGATQGDCVLVLMRALAVVGMLIWLIDGMTKMYINLGPERRWIFYSVVVEGIVVMVGGGMFLFWSFN
ncbi:unnamed protein product [Urochloa decumbens]|uniref:Uncharacterized protein n=1 Tax=Urochloa decumbens TaxID=240449 RepID=A0ABC9F8C5_9POAL